MFNGAVRKFETWPNAELRRPPASLRAAGKLRRGGDRPWSLLFRLSFEAIKGNMAVGLGVFWTFYPDECFRAAFGVKIASLFYILIFLSNL